MELLRGWWSTSLQSCPRKSTACIHRMSMGPLAISVFFGDKKYVGGLNSFIFGATRWIAGCAMAFAQISAIFASNPAGPLPLPDLEAMESAYMSYRKDYNRISLTFCLFVFPQKNLAFYLTVDHMASHRRSAEVLRCGLWKASVCCTKFGPRCTASSTWTLAFLIEQALPW